MVLAHINSFSNKIKETLKPNLEQDIFYIFPLFILCFTELWKES